GAGPEQLVQAAVGGTLATPRARREATARGLQELVSSGALADSAAIDRSVHLARCPPQVAHALDLGSLAPSELWCADVPLSVESALLLAGPEGVTLAHMSHKRTVIDEAMKLIGIRKMSELVPIDPAKSPLLDTLLKSPEPVVEVRSHQLLRAIWGRRASEPARERLIEILHLSQVVAAPLRGAAGHALGILLAAPQEGTEADLGVLSSFALQAALALERSMMRERMREQAAMIEDAVEERTRVLREANARLQEADRRK